MNMHVVIWTNILCHMHKLRTVIGLCMLARGWWHNIIILKCMDAISSAPCYCNLSSLHDNYLTLNVLLIHTS